MQLHQPIGIGVRGCQNLGADRRVDPEFFAKLAGEARVERFAGAVQSAPEVLECHMVAGGFDYLVKARVADMTAYRKFLGETLLALPGVRETRTYAVMEEVKRDAPLPVG